MSTHLTLLGTGTSQGVPVVGCDCEVCSSSDTKDKRLRTSALLRNADSTLLIDCGPDVRQQLLREQVKGVDALLITHEHNDHLIGLDDLRSLIFKQKAPMRIYAEPRVQQSIRERFAYAFAEKPYPGAPRFEMIAVSPGEILNVSSLPPVHLLRVMHGELPILGIRVADTAYLTDVKTVPEETRNQLEGLDSLLTSSLHHHQHHSHMNLEEALTFAEMVRAKQTYFMHMSHLMGTHTSVSETLPDGVALAYDGLDVEVG